MSHPSLNSHYGYRYETEWMADSLPVASGLWLSAIVSIWGMINELILYYPMQYLKYDLIVLLFHKILQGTANLKEICLIRFINLGLKY